MVLRAGSRRAAAAPPARVGRAEADRLGAASCCAVGLPAQCQRLFGPVQILCGLPAPLVVAAPRANPQNRPFDGCELKISFRVSDVGLCFVIPVSLFQWSSATMGYKSIWLFGALFHLPCNQEPVGESPGL